MTTRRQFIRSSILAGASVVMLPKFLSTNIKGNIIMTINGPLDAERMGFTLTHEHVLADFIGAAKYSKSRYDADEVFRVALPFMQEVKDKGCTTFIDCSPAYLGRDIGILKRLADATGLNIITNTGYYGAVNEKFLPPQAYTETSQQLANRWIAEAQRGIEGTSIKPGFLKTSVDNAPLTPTQRKIIDAAAITHLATGLTLAIHTGNGDAANEQLEILGTRGVSPTARVWVHAQNEKNKVYHVEAARRKSWVSFDGVNPDTIAINIEYLQNMKANKLLQHVLVSQDSGWYNVGEANGGNYKPYTCIFNQFIPAMKENGFSAEEIDVIFKTNPQKAFSISVRKS